MTAPLCRYCGKEIRKLTKTVLLHVPHPNRTVSRDYTDVDVLPKNKAEAQKLTNHQIVSVRRTLDDEAIDKFTTWDGESYVDKYFCGPTHAQHFGYVMAKAGHATAAYTKAKGGTA